jgi:hypothetical protein
MRQEESKSSTVEKRERHPCGLRLPGFISDEDLGLGDVVKRVTQAFGIKPCTGCERRAAALNRWFVLSGRRPQ